MDPYSKFQIGNAHPHRAKIETNHLPLPSLVPDLTCLVHVLTALIDQHTPF